MNRKREVVPREYDKANFIKFLEKYNVNDGIINKFAELPESITVNKNRFELLVNVTWYNVGNTHYGFEMNYYCKEEIEYLFRPKVFTDIELSVNNLMCDLLSGNFIDDNKKCR